MASLICSASRGAGGPNHGMQPTAHCAAADAGRSATAGRGIAPSTGRSTRLHGGRSVQAPSPWAPALLLLSRSPVAFESARLRHANTTCSSHPPFSPLNTNLAEQFGEFIRAGHATNLHAAISNGFFWHAGEYQLDFMIDPDSRPEATACGGHRAKCSPYFPSLPFPAVRASRAIPGFRPRRAAGGHKETCRTEERNHVVC